MKPGGFLSPPGHMCDSRVLLFHCEIFHRIYTKETIAKVAASCCLLEKALYGN